MSTLSLRLPESLHEQVRKLAQPDGVSINQFISSAVAEKMSALMTEDYLKKRAKEGNENAFFAAMNKVPNVQPEEADRI